MIYYPIDRSHYLIFNQKLFPPFVGRPFTIIYSVYPTVLHFQHIYLSHSLILPQWINIWPPIFRGICTNDDHLFHFSNFAPWLPTLSSPLLNPISLIFCMDITIIPPHVLLEFNHTHSPHYSFFAPLLLISINALDEFVFWRLYISVSIPHNFVLSSRRGSEILWIH